MSAAIRIAAGGVCEGCGARITAETDALETVPNGGADVSLAELLGSPTQRAQCPICGTVSLLLVIGVILDPWRVVGPPDADDAESGKAAEKAYERMIREDAAAAEARGGRLDPMGGARG